MTFISRNSPILKTKRSLFTVNNGSLGRALYFHTGARRDTFNALVYTGREYTNAKFIGI